MLLDKLNEIFKLRNKLCFILTNGVNKDIIETFTNEYKINSVDIGLELSNALFNEDLHKQLSIIALEKFNGIIEDNISVFMGQDTIVLYNLGILFEDDLKLNLESILLEISKSVLIILLWEGEVSTHGLHFLSKKNGKLLALKKEQYLLLEI
ncbi:MAG: hypothetical protein P9L97_00915 [Candidatus Tenebribacter davisii]|nr:hypothetical protein [Candidatus Tenebribacter davisii]